MTSEVMAFSPADGVSSVVISTDLGAAPRPARAAHVGSLLREWRAARRVSQLDLALEAGVSARHIS